MAVGTATPTSVSAGDWTLDAGSDEVSAVVAPDDDDTSKVQSLNVISSYQTYACSVSGIAVGDTVTQVVVYARVKRALSSDVNFTIGYSFAINGGGTQSGTSGTLTATSAWANQSYTHGSLSAAWGGSFTITATVTQARYMEMTTFYAEVTYTPAGGGQLVARIPISSKVGGLLL